MDTIKFLDILKDLGGTFFTGVPDSLLGPFIDAVMDKHGISDTHIVTANEGAAVGLAAGHYLATSRPAVVYMQNSGIGNAVNPICSLLHKKVYSIPAIFVIGWRGEPGVKDEPQHVFQGEITLPLLDCLEIPYIVISGETGDLSSQNEIFKQYIKNGNSVAFVIKKDALQYDKKVKYASDAVLSREEALTVILDDRGGDKGSLSPVFVCTTGKLSREVFELREKHNDGHGSDFLTVGSMGHSLMIAYGIALAKPEKRVFCLDGDGAVLMHMGSLAVVGAHKPGNLIHIVFNNGAHETVGGLPTVCGQLDLSETAKSLGYRQTFQVKTKQELSGALKDLIDAGARILECACGPCIGVGQAPRSGAVSLRTFNRNFEGRSGTADAQVYLVSPETAAISAITGVLTDPTSYAGKFTSVGEITIGDSPDNLIDMPASESEREFVEIIRGPNIKPFPIGKPLETVIENKILLRVGDNITTDHITPAGVNQLLFRSNIPEYSKFCLTRCDKDFPARAKEWGGGIIIGGENYGQGSSREHAALVPLYLGVRAVIAKSFARIHRANLINTGIVPLTFENREEYDICCLGDVLEIDFSLLNQNKAVVTNKTKYIKFNADIPLSERQRAVLLSGGLLNYTRGNIKND